MQYPLFNYLALFKKDFSYFCRCFSSKDPHNGLVKTEIILAAGKMKLYKRDSVTRFSIIFLWKYSTWAPHEQAKTVSQTFLFSQRLQSKKIACQHCQWLRRHAIFSLGKGVLYLYRIAIGYLNTPKYLFSPDCSFKICEKPSKFSKSVSIVIDHAGTVTS